MSHRRISHTILPPLVGIALVLSSCYEGINVANKDGYDDYNVGMYINGVEYHEKIRGIFSPPINCGFCASTKSKSKVIFIEGGYRDLGTNNKAEIDNTYGFVITMCVDSAQYNPATKYHFMQSALSKQDLYNMFFHNFSLERLDSCIVIGTVRDQDYVTYNIKDGWLLLGDNSLIVQYEEDAYYRYQCALFEFYAESEEGKGLNVTNGFCKFIQ